MYFIIGCQNVVKVHICRHNLIICWTVLPSHIIIYPTYISQTLLISVNVIPDYECNVILLFDHTKYNRCPTKYRPGALETRLTGYVTPGHHQMRIKATFTGENKWPLFYIDKREVQYDLINLIHWLFCLTPRGPGEIRVMRINCRGKCLPEATPRNCDQT